MRVLFVCNTGTYLRRVWLPLAKSLRERGADVVLAGPEDEAAELLRRDGFRYEPLRLPRGAGNPLSEARAFLDVLRLYRRERPDVVHQFTIKPILYGSTAARLAGIPVRLSTVSGLGSIFARDGLLPRTVQTAVLALYRVVLAGSRSWVFFQNSDDLELFVRRSIVPRERAVLIRGSGIDTDVFAPAPLPEGEPVVLCAARLLWDKGIGEYVEAARRLRQEGVQARFLLAGPLDEGQPTAIPRSTLEEWQAEGAIEYVGNCRDMVGLLHRSTLVVLPTKYREGIPRILIEAAATGRPIVATDLPGCREICIDEVTGKLIEPGDVSALAATIQNLLEDPAACAELGRQGRELAVDDFDLRRVLNETVAAYRSAAGVPPAAPFNGSAPRGVALPAETGEGATHA